MSMKIVGVGKDYWKNHIELMTPWWSPETPALWLSELNSVSGLRPSEIVALRVVESDSDDDSDEDFNPFRIECI